MPCLVSCLLVWCGVRLVGVEEEVMTRLVHRSTVVLS